jgi:Protein of unknown function (DUF2442)/Domain of unknown function (DUF4160)
MPTVLRSGPYRFYFYSHEPNEPPHIHVDRDNLSVKFWLNPVQLAGNFGFRAHELREIQSLVVDSRQKFLEAWNEFFVASSVHSDERVLEVQFTEDTISVGLVDGRVITVPLVWYPRLLGATASQRENWKIAGGGFGIHWPDIDEDLSTEGLLRGAPAPRAG